MALHTTFGSTSGLSCVILFLALAGCQTYNSQPITQTDGTYLQAPNAYLKAAVWGARQESVQSLTTWLMKRGLILVDDVKMNQIASDIRVNHTGTPVFECRRVQTGEDCRSQRNHLYRYGCHHLADEPDRRPFRADP